ncbi:MAG TPA: helix-turn-helix domain-containing protein [Geminicoccaceae bacterium]|mgnify:CR=1 FL=1|nr:helix-turn-helix domain-containing protein [Geminicoccus sp.]HMU49097.1 helix-turn-helix domain-containing protein [Geminicoccaceae bacterium]
MRSYGQFCPVAKAAELFCERWTALILRDLVAGATRFSQLRRGVPLASPTLLSRRLKELEAEGIVERHRSSAGSRWLYRLTPAGEEFAPIIEALGIWGQRWTRRELAKHEIDLTLLMWGLELGVRPDAFGMRRCVVKLTFTDQPEGTRDWWLVNQDSRVELCIEEPGFEVDLYLASTLPDMIYVYRGDLTLARAIGEGRLDVHGAAWARRTLSRWLVPSPLAEVKSQRVDARAA